LNWMYGNLKKESYIINTRHTFYFGKNDEMDKIFK